MRSMKFSAEIEPRIGKMFPGDSGRSGLRTGGLVRMRN